MKGKSNSQLWVVHKFNLLFITSQLAYDSNLGKPFPIHLTLPHGCLTNN